MSVPFTQVQSKGQTGTTSASVGVTWTGNPTSGNTIFVVFGSNNATFSTVSAITDSLGNSYSKVDSSTNTMDGELWYAANISGGTTPTVTLTIVGGTGINYSVLLVEYNGLQVKPLNRHAVSTGNSTTINSATTGVTDTASQLVIVWGANQQLSSSFSAGAGFGNLVSQAGTSSSVALQDKTVTSTGTQTGSITQTTGVWVGGVATFMTGNRVQFSNLRPHAFSPGLAR